MQTSLNTKPTHPPARHFGPLPADDDLRAEIRAANAVGWRTVTSSTWAALEALGIGPDDLELAP